MTQTASLTEQTWATDKIRESYNGIFAASIVNARRALSKYGPEAVASFEASQRKMRIDTFTKMKLKSPLELVHAIAIVETNIFGSELRCSGNEQTAQVTWLNCGVLTGLMKCNLSQEEQGEMFGCFGKFVDELAAAHGFKGKLEMKENVASATFSI